MLLRSLNWGSLLVFSASRLRKVVSYKQEIEYALCQGGPRTRWRAPGDYTVLNGQYASIWVYKSRILTQKAYRLQSIMGMISENIVKSVLVTILLVLSLGRLFISYRFPLNWPWHKIDLALCALPCIFFALLTGLFWSNRFPAWGKVLFWVTSIFPPLHAVGRQYIELD